MRRRRPEDQETYVGLHRTVTPTSTTRHTHEKRLSVSPEVSLGGFLLVRGDLGEDDDPQQVPGCLLPDHMTPPGSGRTGSSPTAPGGVRFHSSSAFNPITGGHAPSTGRRSWAAKRRSPVDDTWLDPPTTCWITTSRDARIEGLVGIGASKATCMVLTDDV